MQKPASERVATAEHPNFVRRKLFARASCLLLLVAGLVLAFSRLAVADMTIAATADEVQPVAVGEMAPTFTVQTVDGDDFEFAPSKLERPAIIITFRGGWCPYCNLHLSELRHVIPEISELGVDVLFFSGDRPELLYSSLKPDTQDDIEGLDYTIYSDATGEAAMALGIAFAVDPAYAGKMKERDRDIDGSSIEQKGILPVPAVFAVGTDGIVAYSKAIPDYKVRVSADEVLAVAKKLADE